MNLIKLEKDKERDDVWVGICYFTYEGHFKTKGPLCKKCADELSFYKLGLVEEK
jgi:hypothetical protein